MQPKEIHQKQKEPAHSLEKLHKVAATPQHKELSTNEMRPTTKDIV